MNIIQQSVSKIHKFVNDPHKSSDHRLMTNHICDAISSAPIIFDPAPHVFVKNIFPHDVYIDIVKYFKLSHPVFLEQIHKSDPKIVGSYSFRLEARVPNDTASLDKKISSFWNNLRLSLESRMFFDTIFEKFSSSFADRFGKNVPIYKIYNSVRSTVLLAKHRTDYYLWPHTDCFEKIVSCIFNCAEHVQLDHLGTAIYSPKIKDFTCKGTAHHNPKMFDLMKMSPYIPNSALLFFRNDRFFHGVERITNDCLLDSERPNIQYKLWAK